jgi:hypothetical protein
MNVSNVNIREIYFLPPLAIARVSGSDTPQDSFRWQTSIGIHGAAMLAAGVRAISA